jgi:hypothetical protein
MVRAMFDWAVAEFSSRRSAHWTPENMVNRIGAAEKLLDRALGRPKQLVAVGGCQVDRHAATTAGEHRRDARRARKRHDRIMRHHVFQ